MATSPDARRPPGCSIPGTPSTFSRRRSVSDTAALLFACILAADHKLMGAAIDLLGPRMMFGNIGSHEAFLRRKLEEQQQAAELQQAIDLQSRRFMGLQILDLKRGHHHLGSPVAPPLALRQTDGIGNGNAIHLEDAAIQGFTLLTS